MSNIPYGDTSRGMNPEAIRNEQSRLDAEIRRHNTRSFDAGIDLNQSLYSDDNNRIGAIKDPNFRNQLVMEE